MSTWSELNDPNAAPVYALIVAGLGLYAVVFAYSILYISTVQCHQIGDAAVSTSMLQQLAVLGLILLFLRGVAMKRTVARGTGATYQFERGSGPSGKQS